MSKEKFKTSKERREAVNAWREANKAAIKAAAEEGISLTAYRKKHGTKIRHADGTMSAPKVKAKKASVLPKKTVERIRKIKASSGPAQPKANTGWSPEEEQRIAAIMAEAKCSRLTAIQKMKRENMAKKSTAAIPAPAPAATAPATEKKPHDPLASATPVYA